MLAARLNLPLANSAGYELLPLDAYALRVTEERLELILRKKSGVHCLFVEFVTGPLGYRRQHGGGKNQGVARAVGLKNAREKPTVLDATAGLGQEGFILASLGCTVVLVERSPIIAALLLDGLSRAEQIFELRSTVQLIKVIVADAKEVLEDLSQQHCPDVVYLDPMFPAKSKNALNKIEMRMIRDIAGTDEDADQLFALALRKAKKRVVVKRPKHARALLDLPPSFVIKGNSNRYDVYLTRGV